MISDDWACGCVHSGASGLLSHFSDFDDPEIREILRQHDLGDITLWREILLDAASELSSMGLGQVAKVCLQESCRRPSQFDRPNEWASTEEQHWRDKMERERRQWEEKRQQRG